MTNVRDSPEENLNKVTSSSPPPPPTLRIELLTIAPSKTLEEVASFVENSLQQTLVYQRTIEESIDSDFESSRSRLSQIRETSSAYLQQSIYSLQDVVNEYRVYEDVTVGYVKAGVNVALSHPLITGGTLLCLGFVILKRMVLKLL